MPKTLWMLVATMTVAAATQARAERPCPPDIDCSGVVDVDDLVQVVLDWGSVESSADVDGSGVVDVDDLVLVVLGWGGCVFDDPPPPVDIETLQIGLEMLGPDGPLVPRPEVLARIENDLTAIRAAVPALVGQMHHPAWLPDQIIVQLWQGSDLTEYDCLNTYYQVVDEEHLFSSGGADWMVLTFAQSLNAPRIAAIYAELEAIGATEPNFIIGGQNSWEPTPLQGGVWSWTIDDGWHDCFDGCDCHREYVIETTADGGVEVIEVDEYGAPWCEF